MAVQLDLGAVSAAKQPPPPPPAQPQARPQKTAGGTLTCPTCGKEGFKALHAHQGSRRCRALKLAAELRGGGWVVLRDSYRLSPRMLERLRVEHRVEETGDRETMPPEPDRQTWVRPWVLDSLAKLDDTDGPLAVKVARDEDLRGPVRFIARYEISVVMVEKDGRWTTLLEEKVPLGAPQSKGASPRYSPAQITQGSRDDALAAVPNFLFALAEDETSR